MELQFLSLVTLVLLLVMQCEEVLTATCIKVDSCTCKFDDGSGVISLKTLANPAGGQPRFNFTQATRDSYFYAYNPCNSFKWNAPCGDVAVCQMSSDGKEIFDAGNQPTASFDAEGTTITYTASARTTTVNLICSPSATTPVYEPQGEGAVQEKYAINLTSNCACKNGCLPGGLSPGSALCIIFSVLVILYLVVGVLFLKFVRGAEGKELIPNYEFWKELPLLIKDGVLFVVHGCKSDSNNYETI